MITNNFFYISNLRKLYVDYMQVYHLNVRQSQNGNHVPSVLSRSQSSNPTILNDVTAAGVIFQNTYAFLYT